MKNLLMRSFPWENPSGRVGLFLFTAFLPLSMFAIGQNLGDIHARFHQEMGIGVISKIGIFLYFNAFYYVISLSLFSVSCLKRSSLMVVFSRVFLLSFGCVMAVFALVMWLKFAMIILPF